MPDVIKQEKPIIIIGFFLHGRAKRLAIALRYRQLKLAVL